jgi:chaperonin GroES
MAPQFPFKPLSNQVVVLPDPLPTRSGMIHLPETAMQSRQTKTGTVVRVGMGKQTVKGVIPIQLNVGDKVVFGEFAGVSFTIGTKGYLVMREDEITGVIEPAYMPMEQEQELNDPEIFKKNAKDVLN